ncbi:MAG TPA: hypothetical protein VFG59_12965, partial [Anaeromyxobacter sp.]|nr:hypothetical protein [Anaeromyxobacter sp.]
MVQRCAYPLVLLALAAARPARPAEQPPPQPIIAYLNEVVRWYHEQGAVELLSGDPGDVVFADGVRRNARQVLQLAFVFARADAVLEPSPSAPANGAAGGGQGLTAMARRVDEASAAVERAQADVDALQRQLSQATAADRPLLGERLAEARGELQLATVRKDTLAGMAEFASEAGLGGGGGLLGQIDELQRAVPESTSQGAPPAPVPTQPTASRPAEGGIAALTAQAVGLGQKVRQLRGDEALTARLREDSRKLTTPLAGTLRGTLQAADQLEQAPATDDPATLKERIQSLAELTSRFKAVSSALVPLGKVNLLLDAHRANLAQWRAAVNAQFDSALWTLLLHLAFLAAAIAAILVASGFWRRATFRYVRDPRR